MKVVSTSLGKVCVGPPEALFASLASMMSEAVSETQYPPGIALTGGSSPKAFFSWLAKNPERLPEAKHGIIFTVSDERYVLPDSEESNFGNAERLFLDQVGVTPDHRFPWDTIRPLEESAHWYEKLWSLSFGEQHAYDLCMLGMGDDCHTASLFPGSALLQPAALESEQRLFAAVEVPGKGGRLTVTAKGLECSSRIVILVMGASKSAALRRVFDSTPAAYSEIPIRLMDRFPDKVVWLIDEAAASELTILE